MVNRKQGERSRRRKAELQGRDLELLRELERWGVLGLGQIDGLVFHKELPEGERAGLFFNEHSHKLYRLSGYKRLQDLKESGHVTSHFYRDFPMVFTLASRGHRALKKAKLAQLPGFRRSASGQLVEHEVMVNAVGLVLSKLRGLTVRTIRERTEWNRRGGWGHTTSAVNIPDLWISDDRQPKAVEIELTQKAAGRYPPIWEVYRVRLRESRALVLYLTGWPGGPELMKRQAIKLGLDFIYACTLADFRASAGRSAFTNCEGRTLSLGMAPAAPLIGSPGLALAPRPWTSNLQTIGGAA